MCLQLTKMHHTKWNKERGDQLEDNSHPALPPHTASSLGHRMELEGTRGRRNTCKVWHVATGQARKLGSQSCCRKQQNSLPRRIKRNKQSCEKTKATDVFVKLLHTLIQGRWSSDFRAKTSCLAYNNKISKK